jgi:hypothetical protein
MPNTFTLIASSTVGAGGASTIDFTSIPSTYTDLLVKLSTREPNQDFVLCQFNNDTGANYSSRFVRGNGSTTASATSTSLRVGVSASTSGTANTFSNCEFYVPNYAGSNQKSVSTDATDEVNATANYMFLSAGLWTGTSAITSIKLFSNAAANFVQYSTAYLYGIKNS